MGEKFTVKRLLKLISVLLASIGLVIGMTTTSAAGYPTELVNGFFNYPNLLNSTRHWAYIYLNGTWDQGTAIYLPIAGWDSAAFGWNATEIQRDVSGNVYGEIGAKPTDSLIYQDIETTPGAIYKWRLRHCSRTSSFVDAMQVLIGSPSSQTMQLATRLNSNGISLNVTYDGILDTNQAGWQGYTITTPSSSTLQNPWSHEADWEFYVGTYEPPAGQTVTRFTYQAVQSAGPALGNAIDNIEFKMAFPLYYHSDATTGTRPDPEGKDQYRGVYFRDESVAIAENPGNLTREGYIFYGWTQTAPSSGNDWLFHTQADAATSGAITTLTMPASVQHVYAVWYEDPEAAPTPTPTPSATPTATQTATSTPVLTPTPRPSEGVVPQTGDHNDPMALAILLTAAVLIASALGYVWLKQRRSA